MYARVVPELNYPSRWLTALDAVCRCAGLLIIILAVSLTTLAQRPGQKRPVKREPATSAPAEEKPQPSGDDAFDRAKSAPTPEQRIILLERFIRTERGGRLETEARQLLMREYALQGEQFLREGNAQAASRVFKAAFRAAPANITDKIFGQYIFPLPMAMNSFGYRVESVELMRSFERRFENAPNRLIEIGFFYVQIEAPTEAVRVLEQAVKLAPDDHRAHNSLGSAYLIDLRLEDAVEQFQRALELDEKDEYANLNLGNLARSVGDYKRAVSYYNNQIALKTDDSEAHGGLAIALLELGRDEEAEVEIKRAVDLAPGDYRFLTQLSYFYITRKKAAAARPLIERSLQIEPRYVWTHIAKAETDLMEAKYGDALATLISAQQYGSFPTLTFELAKALMALDGYDQAIEVLRKSFHVNDDNEFETMLGGAVKARSPRLDLLLERERRAAMFLNDQPTTALQYRLAEALARIDRNLEVAIAAHKARDEAAGKKTARTGKAKNSRASDELQSATRPRRARTSATLELSAGADSDLPGVPELIRELTAFTTLDDGRQPFRMVWASRKLTDTGIALDAAEQLARQAVVLADAATEPAGSMRDAPLLDRDGRRAVFLGRAHDALGWALFKKGDARAAVTSLSKAVDVYPQSMERKTALWHLAVATEEAGNERRALDLYIASYDPNLPTSSVRRSRIEALYKKLNGSLTGLDEKLKNQ